MTTDSGVIARSLCVLCRTDRLTMCDRTVCCDDSADVTFVKCCCVGGLICELYRSSSEDVVGCA